MKAMEYDTTQTGLQAVLKDYQEIAMRILWETSSGLGSRQVWEETNRRLKTETISRASIINFLEAMREDGVLGGDDVTGKGGHRWIYKANMNEAEFKVYLAETLIRCLKENFPDETRKALAQLPL